MSGFVKAFLKLAQLGGVVVLTLVIVCFPFLSSLDQVLQLIIRLFPIARGVFEDKVANVWCVINIVYKLKVLFSNENMAKICLLSTSIAVIPSLYDIFNSKSLMKFKFSLINCALAFFLFSYQVHEKTILLVAIPVLLILSVEPLACVWFLNISVFSMFPLLLKDKLLLPYIALNVIFMLTFESSSLRWSTEGERSTKSNGLSILKKYRLIDILYYASLIGCVVITFGACTITPPKRYPDIFSLLVSVYSCLHFLGFFVYFNVKQWTFKESKNKLL